MQRQRRIKKQSTIKISWIITAIILVLFFTVFITFHQAEKPMNTARSQTVSMAKKYAGLTTVSSFYSSNLNKTYYSVAGKDNKGRKIYVIIAKKGGNITVINQNSGLSETEIRNVITEKKSPQKINSISLTLINSKPYWVVSYLNSDDNLCFATLNFKTGNVYKSIENI
ncbi:cell wall elongation regulator TseB-like domain-containing protein [Lentilactobacillus kisonensis]|uniref:Cell wall elongation regulator TseB-like domain-containing protein n=2 Tax=Lentilactobacillus kisonensis TaxID=481722 RepID=H1LG74_9LACO|nr:DUF5590 domain-containing protein [Lentilactobacillus kisonensis]EHO51086.1 hypothetical protein HMPREF9104_01600 [Lentilactobacillus kisonensis F0435]KRL23401.1 hypothetical protein FC98_GL000127 [Lentilactobacillus kisonensis DSM 19906 = JCM 15041]